MEQAGSQSVIATGFCLSSQAIKTRVHFFPFAGAVSGPYSIAATFTLFGKGVEKRSITVDGGRLGQPDGIRLEDAFQTMRGDVSGIFGLQVSLLCQNQRAVMNTSQLAIEVVSPQFTMVYGVPFVPFAAGETSLHVDPEVGYSAALRDQHETAGALVQDAFAMSSIVVVNPSDEVLRPNLFRVVDGKRVSLQLGTVAPHSTVEIPLEEGVFRAAQPIECGWGLVRAEAVYRGVSDETARLSPEHSPAYFIVYREPVTKKPISVSAL